MDRSDVHNARGLGPSGAGSVHTLILTVGSGGVDGEDNRAVLVYLVVVR